MDPLQTHFSYVPKGHKKGDDPLEQCANLEILASLDSQQAADFERESRGKLSKHDVSNSSTTPS